MKPKGLILLIGGAEQRGEEAPDIEQDESDFTPYEIFKKILKEVHIKKILFITSGKDLHKETQEDYKKAFKKLGFKAIDFIFIESREDGENEDHIEKAKKAGVVFFTGGDQFYHATLLGGTSLITAIKDKYIHTENFIIAGTSAGAMVIPSVIIASGGQTEALLHQNLVISSGFSLLPHCIVDTHFIKRGRFSRLTHAILLNPEKLGVGLGEDSAVLIRNGEEAECIGSGMVIIIDGSEIKQSNIAEAKEGEPIYLSNVKAYFLVRGCKFLLKKRKFIPPKS
ncbi:cyanophycinase [Legionella busanensis]|uniref:Cyanophycinase n=1 Tax=Legionella busanensis TaxID=190655 RepID=A0A378JLS5_9GAMM|nr:cyanophycinase [Legionella busanensis]STX51040.1 cyanophycinase [Legionella busanensis]